MEYILASNDFQFNNQFFLQISGTAMGKIFSPHYADIYMADWERTALAKSRLLPTLYLRYLDDIFIIWEHSKQEFEQFFNILNTHHPSIKLKHTLSDTHVDFLDVTIFKGPGFLKTGTLDTKVYFKPTDTHALLHRSSHHPQHTFRGIIKSQILRFHRICSNKMDFDDATSTLFTALTQRGYSTRYLHGLLRTTITQTLSPNHSEHKYKHKQQTITTYTIKNLHKLPTNGHIFTITCTICERRGVYYASNVLANMQQFTMAIHNDTTDDPLLHHFHWHGHTAISITLLENTPVQLRDLPQRLNQWIERLNTLTPYGFNVGYHRLQRQIPFTTPHFPGSGLLLKETAKALQETGLDKIHNIRVFAAQRGGRNLTQHLVRAQHNTYKIEQLTGRDNSREQPIPKPSPEVEPLTWINTTRRLLLDSSCLQN